MASAANNTSKESSEGWQDSASKETGKTRENDPMADKSGQASTSKETEELSQGWQNGAAKGRYERWQAKRSTVMERNKYMFNNPVMSDIKFAFPNKQTIPAHKYVLAISSPVFFAMFYGDLAEKSETVDITDCDPEVFLQFLRYVYYDDANFQGVNIAIQVWYLADKYDIPSLAKECVKFLDGVMDPLQAFDVIQHAIRLKDDGLENTCWEVIDYNAERIVVDDSFLEVKHELLLSFVERSSVPIEEITLFRAVDRWATRRCEEANKTVDGANKRSVLGEDLLKHIRFSLMSPQEFSDVVLPTEILSQSEVIDVFKQLTSVSVPGGIKFSIRPRIESIPPFYFFSIGDPSEEVGKASQSIRQMLKEGMLTFTVRETIKLCGVKIITDEENAGSSHLHVHSLSVSQGGKRISQITDKSFLIRKGSKYGEIEVFFNRPFILSENTCYTIETETGTSQNNNTFVWSESLQDSLLKHTYYHTGRGHKGIVSGHCSGLYTECIPANACYKGEIMGLLINNSG